MIDRLSILCFAGTYGLALAGDLARFALRASARWYLTVALTAVGWLVQTIYLTNLAWRSGGLPVTTLFESLLMLAWILAAIDLYLVLRSPKPTAVGLFVLPIVLVLSILAGGWAPRTGWMEGTGPSLFWGSAHGLLLLAGSVSTCVAFAAGLMYLVQSNRLKRKRPARFGFTLPSLEQSERLNRGAITVAFPLLTFGLLIGLVLVAAEEDSGLSWTDPKILSASAMWCIFAALLHARYRPEMRGRRVMILTVFAFLFLAFTIVGIDLLRIPTAHGNARNSGPIPKSSPTPNATSGRAEP